MEILYNTGSTGLVVAMLIGVVLGAVTFLLYFPRLKKNIEKVQLKIDELENIIKDSKFLQEEQNND